MFDPKYGMFSYNEESRMFWFASMTVENQDSYFFDELRLIGRLIGLAIYNSVILDLKFPPAIYKKLQNEPLGFEDLKLVDPILYHSLKQVLEYEGPVDDLFDWTFTIDVDVFGSKVQVELIENGKDKKVDNENKQEFVELYADYVLNKSIHDGFKVFKEGFDLVCEGSAIQIFRSEELEQLICGDSDLDFEALESVTQYDGGFGPETDVIRYFWKTVLAFNDEQRKKLLFFATGSDRVPIGGLAKLNFTIAKNGPDSDRLPSSHTCFNVLLLPEYSSCDKLETRLLLAIDNAEGFGMI
jgi:hypothetical protein